MVRDWLILWMRFHPRLVRCELVPEIEKNCTQFGWFSQKAYDSYCNNKFAPFSIYFYHGYAETDIPIGQEYEAVALSKGYDILPDTIQQCHAKVMSFFTSFHTVPSDCAMRGHHGLSLIQFQPEIPQVINDLYEIKELVPSNPNEYRVFLGSKLLLHEYVRQRAAEQDAVKLLKTFGIRTEDYYELHYNKLQPNLYREIKSLVTERYQLREAYVQEVLNGGLSRLWREQHPDGKRQK